MSTIKDILAILAGGSGQALNTYGDIEKQKLTDQNDLYKNLSLLAAKQQLDNADPLRQKRMELMDAQISRLNRPSGGGGSPIQRYRERIQADIEKKMIEAGLIKEARGTLSAHEEFSKKNATEMGPFKIPEGDPGEAQAILDVISPRRGSGTSPFSRIVDAREKELGRQLSSDELIGVDQSLNNDSAFLTSLIGGPEKTSGSENSQIPGIGANISLIQQAKEAVSEGVMSPEEASQALREAGMSEEDIIAAGF